MNRFWRLALSLFAVLGLVLAACGGDDDDTSAADDTGDTTTTVADSGDSQAAVGGDCGFLVDFAGAFEDVGNPMADVQGSAEGSMDFGALYANVADVTQRMADAAPSEIEADFQVIADAFGSMAAELEGVEIDFSNPESMDPEALAALDGLEANFDAEFEAAANNIDTWIQANCGDLSGELDLGNLETLGG